AAALRLEGHIGGAARRFRPAIERRVDRPPVGPVLHPAIPARDVRITAIGAADHLAERDHARGEIIGDGNRVAAKPGSSPGEKIPLEHPQETLGVALARRDRQTLRGWISELVILEEL